MAGQTAQTYEVAHLVSGGPPIVEIEGHGGGRDTDGTREHADGEEGAEERHGL